jgi:hypothetical protein
LPSNEPLSNEQLVTQNKGDLLIVPYGVSATIDDDESSSALCDTAIVIHWEVVRATVFLQEVLQTPSIPVLTQLKVFVQVFPVFPPPLLRLTNLP